MLLLIGDPLGDTRRHGCAGGGDEDEAIEESVVDGALEAMLLVKPGELDGVDCRPLRPGFLEMGCPGTVGHGAGDGDFLTIDGDNRLAREVERAAARTHREGEGGDI